MVTKKVNFSILNPSASKEILIQNIQLGVNDIQLCPYDFIMYFFYFTDFFLSHLGFCIEIVFTEINYIYYKNYFVRIFEYFSLT